MSMMIEEQMIHQQCVGCAMHWMQPKFFDDQRRRDKKDFYCPNGHAQAYRESEADVLRRERDRLQQRLAQKDDEIRDLEGRRRAALGQVTKLRKRVGNGVCPCCTRSFANVERHMRMKHPEFKAEAAE